MFTRWVWIEIRRPYEEPFVPTMRLTKPVYVTSGLRSTSTSVQADFASCHYLLFSN